MRCEEIMKRNVECISQETTVQEAARRMRDRNIGFLPVCDDGMHVLGTITDRDLALRVLASDLDGSVLVNDVMTRDAVTCAPNDALDEAARSLARHHKSRIMVIDDDRRLVGVISLSDLARNVKDKQVARTLREVTEREVTVA